MEATNESLISSAPESAKMTPITINYLAFHAGQLIAGIPLLVVGITGLFFYNSGLLLFLFPFPPWIFTSLIPLSVSLVFILRTVIMMEKVSISDAGETLTITTTRLWKNIATVKKSEIRYFGFTFIESKFMRWSVIFILFILSCDVFFKIGMELLGFARIASFLIFCFILTVAGIVIYIAFPRKFIELGKDKEVLFIPLPRWSGRDSRRDQILKFLGTDEKFIASPGERNPFRVLFDSNLFPAIFGALLITIAVLLMVHPDLYFGEFTVPIYFTLGAKLMAHSFQGNKKSIKLDDDASFLGCSSSLLFKKFSGAKLDETVEITASRIHVLEMVCYFYLISQAVKYGFRFAWWSYANFNLAYFTLSIIISCFIFVYWFGPAKIMTAKFENFSISFKIDFNQMAPDAPRQRPGLQAIQKMKNFKNSLASLRKNRKSTWTWIVFLLFVLLSILYYAIFTANLLF